VTNLTQFLEQRDLYINFGSSARTQSILDCSSSREEMVKERLIELAALKRRSVRRGKRSQRITRDIYDWDSQSRPSRPSPNRFRAPTRVFVFQRASHEAQ
jgi:hypothetical protein